MFSIVCAGFLSDDLPLDYTQHDMLLLRNNVAAAVINGSLDYKVKTVQIISIIDYHFY